MKSFLQNIAKQAWNAFLIFLFLGLFAIGAVYAAISWPASAPSGETAGGKFAAVINSVLSSGDWKNP